MKIQIALLLALIALVQSKNILLDLKGQKNVQKKVSVKKQDHILVELTDNPSTGYQWLFVNKDEFDLDGHSAGEIVIGLVHEEYVQDSKDLEDSGPIVGRGGIRRLELQAMKAGLQKLDLVYCRPWELGPILGED